MPNLANIDFIGTLSRYLIAFLMVVPALTLHEWAHAFAAYKMGDNTPRMVGRLSLNPLRHIDPVGTVAIPLVLLLVTNGAFSFGYAKPVPINPRNFRDYKKGILITGIAGPLMNLALGAAVALLLRALLFVATLSFGSELTTILAAGTLAGTLLQALYTFAYMNFALAFFNLIPIPPLDGSRIVQRFLSGRARELYNQLERFGFLIVLALAWGTSLLDIYFNWTVLPLMRLLTGF
ncbi:MAG: site-2 protease family protein [Actinomycetes bacterium]|jgi:Zn-dependent protease|nr:site-2 protease family protein [Actinomycetes bacterium]